MIQERWQERKQEELEMATNSEAPSRRLMIIQWPFVLDSATVSIGDALIHTGVATLKKVTKAHSTHTQDPIETKNTAYKRPFLRVYGTVKTLTKGGNGTLVDGANHTKKT